MSAAPPDNRGEYCDECGRVGTSHPGIEAYDSYRIQRAMPMDYKRLYFCRECARELWLYCQVHKTPMLVGRRERENTTRVEYAGACPQCLEFAMRTLPENRQRQLLKFIFEFQLLDDLFSIAQYVLPLETAKLDPSDAKLQVNGAVFGLILTAVLQGATPAELCKHQRETRQRNKDVK